MSIPSTVRPDFGFDTKPFKMTFDISHALQYMDPLEEIDNYEYMPNGQTTSAYESAWFESSTPHSPCTNNTYAQTLHENQRLSYYNAHQYNQYHYSDMPALSPAFYEHEDSVEFPIQSETDNCAMPHYPLQVHETSPKLPSFQMLAEAYIQPRRVQKGRRGRPPTYQKPGCSFSDSEGPESDSDRSSDSPSNTRCRKGAKNILLWKFLLEELRKPGGTHIRWVRERDGVFKFVDTAETSRLWGLKKKKEDMNFEKLSRGIRHYYKDGLMSRVDGTRLVYQFNWSQVPRLYRK